MAAILAADVVAYSRLMGADEEGTLLTLKAVRREITDPKIEEHNGRIVKTTGDGLLVEFGSVVDAVRCAVTIQREMGARAKRRQDAHPMVLRIGVNLGDIIIGEDGDIFGDGVNVAARLEGLAPPGGICVSRVVRDQVRDKLGFGFEDLGEKQVKNISRPVHVFSIPLGETKPAPAPAGRSEPGRQSRSGRALAAVIGGGAATVVLAVVLVLIVGQRSREPPPASRAPLVPVIGEAISFDKDGVGLSKSGNATLDRQAVFLRDNPRIAATIKVYCTPDEGARIGVHALAVLRANKIR
ncbi:MAG: adenylate/guanylate cyclase domain-containing protein, partial [Stellaceae bacterium]